MTRAMRPFSCRRLCVTGHIGGSLMLLVANMMALLLLQWRSVDVSLSGLVMLVNDLLMVTVPTCPADAFTFRMMSATALVLVL